MKRMPVLVSSLAAGAIALALTGALHATDVSMAGGSITFSTPDNWLDIMDTEGDPEARVFQVPDTSATGKQNLARVTVTVKQVTDLNGFQQYTGDATAKALALPGYKTAPVPPQPNTNIYTAQENGTPFNYIEHYWFKDGHAVQLRCVRPAQSEAGAAWSAAFDRGCAAIAAHLK